MYEKIVFLSITYFICVENVESMISNTVLQITVSLALPLAKLHLSMNAPRRACLHTGAHTLVALPFGLDAHEYCSSESSQLSLKLVILDPSNIFPHLVQDTSLLLEHSPRYVHVCAHRQRCTETP